MNLFLHWAYSLLSHVHDCGHGRYWLFDDDTWEI